MDLNELYLFARVVEAGSFPAAARTLGLPASTLSRQIAQLEERLGAPLVHRAAPALELTSLGQAYYQQCARMTVEVADAERQVLAGERELRGRLRVTAPHELAGLGALAAAFLADHPHVELELELMARPADPGDAGVDLALRLDPPATPGLTSRPLGTLARALCAAPAYLDAHPALRAIADLAAHTLIAIGSAWQPTALRLRGPDGAQDSPAPARLSTSSLVAAHQAALAGAGLALLPRHLCQDDLDAGRLRAVLDDAVLPAAVHALYPDLPWLPARVRAFLDALDRHRHLAPWHTPA